MKFLITGFTCYLNVVSFIFYVEGHHDQLQAHADPSDVTRHKIVVMGAARVGKSSLITQFLYRKFSSKYKRTVEEMHHGQFTVDGVKIDLDILDTSGAYEFPAMRALSISSADAFVLVYSVTDPDSFQQAAAIRDQIIETKHTSDVPIVVVGNKLDLANTDRKVPYEETSCLVEVDWENGFVETSAKDNINVGEVFRELLNQAKSKYDLGPSLRRNSARRQSLPSGGGGQGTMVPTPAQLAHLQKKARRRRRRRRWRKRQVQAQLVFNIVMPAEQHLQLTAAIRSSCSSSSSSSSSAPR
ncbi:ras-related protein Rap-2b-like isoform X4 [Adelges cooleyi]|uniref:ras-related protein Rap-2b-like isoform X4 n=1 Tax=Adelges cooleyi TaxID=133065 RepID=UPI0021802237|nr:ras-related protein Rap-2b-like isoform X4 [Adelges cooleyi]